VPAGNALHVGGRRYELEISNLDEGLFDIEVRVADGAGEQILLPVHTICIGSASAGPFMEAGGELTIEAEHYLANITRDLDQWEMRTTLGGFADEGYMVTLPDDGTKYSSGYVGVVSELQYEVDFETAGTFYLSYRGWADTGGNNSVHFGLDGVGLGGLTDVGLGNQNYGEWHWGSTIEDNSRAQFIVAQPGTHIINLWLREDGTNVDRIFISQNQNDIPQGLGPRESFRRIGDNQAPQIQNPGNQSHILGETVDLTLVASDSESQELEWSVQNLPEGLQFDSASRKITGIPSSIESRTVIVSVLDPKGLQDSIQFTWSILDRRVVASAKLVLGGAWDGSGMRTDLNTSSLLPLQSPYSSAPAESVSSDYFQLNPDIVDWVLLELRSSPDANSVVARKAAFIFGDGSIEDADPESGIKFISVASGSYHLVVRHRNHLPVMSLSAKAMSFDSITNFDFMNGSEATYGTEALKSLSAGVFGLWPGNSNLDSIIKYAGATNDRVEVLNRSGGPSPFDFVEGYYWEDINLDGKVVYAGPSNDRVEILPSSGGPTPFNIRYSQVPE